MFDFLILKVRHHNGFVVKQAHYEMTTTLTARLAEIDFLIVLSIAAVVARVISILCCGSISKSSALPFEKSCLISAAFIGLISCMRQHFSMRSRAGNARLKSDTFRKGSVYH